MDHASGSAKWVSSKVAPERRVVPWPIWCAVALLALEGLGNLSAIPGQPMAIRWLAMKFLFIVGLTRGWRWVFVLFLVVALYHAGYFSVVSPVVAFWNLLLVVLVGSCWRFFFENSLTRGKADFTKPLTARLPDPDFDL